MRRDTRLGAGLVAAMSTAMLLTASDAIAGRANDTVTVAEVLPIGTIDIYYANFPQAQFLSDMIYDTLVYYDNDTASVVPLLAETWTEEGDSITFTLRQGVTWHDGEAFDADDVVYTINWLIDPETRFRNKFEWSIIDSVEKIDDHTVRINTTGRRPYDMLQLTHTPIYPQHVHGELEDPTRFGFQPVGTGPYLVVEYDESNNRLHTERFDEYVGGPGKQATNIGNVVFRSVPELGSQIAGLMVGDFDIVRNLPADQMESMVATDQFEMELDEGFGFSFMWFDAAGLSGNEPLTDARVREALSLAVDRRALDQTLSGTLNLELPEQVCWKGRVQDCAYSVSASTDYDPDRARELLAEAGYADGFPLVINTYVGRLAELSEAVAGYFRAVGVNATVEPLIVPNWHRKMSEGTVNMTVAIYNLSGMPDIYQVSRHFLASDDYFQDEELNDIARRMNLEMDREKRAELATAFFDRIAENHYIAPLTSAPFTLTHNSELEFHTKSTNGYGFSITDVRWKDDD